MRIRVKLFAVARQLAKTDQLAIDLPFEAKVSDVRRAVLKQIPELTDLNDHIRFSVDAEFASDDTKIVAESEVACIPPVSGG